MKNKYDFAAVDSAQAFSKYSLQSDEFRAIEKAWKDSVSRSYEGKPRIPRDMSVKDAISLFRKDLHTNMKRLLHEYGMGYTTKTKYKDGRIYINYEISPETQQYVLYVHRYLCERGPGLKPNWHIQGKRAEVAAMGVVNSVFHYFRIDEGHLQLGKTSKAYGGDGGSDLHSGSIRMDAKHRDDGPNHGLILQEKWLSTNHDLDTVLVLCTNISDIGLGHSLTNRTEEGNINQVLGALNEQLYPIAIVGWMTLGEFKEKMELRPGSNNRYVVDDLHDISELIMNLVEDRTSTDNLFVFNE